MKRRILTVAGLLFVLVAATSIWTHSGWATSPASIEEPLRPPFAKPIQNWIVCEDLGLGIIPGIRIERQRFRLCHNQGWELLAYCLQPNWPAPPVGTTCSRINDNTFWCGNGIQNLREYSILQTPSPTPSPTSASTPTPTSTPTQPIPSETPRPRAGGRGNFVFSADFINLLPRVTATRTPFMPKTATPTPFQPLHPTPTHSPNTLAEFEQPSSNFYGIDFKDHQKMIQIRIYPADKRVNQGKPIIISFIPGDECEYEDHRACIGNYKSTANGDVSYITVHSGVGGEAQAFRHAVEGTGLNRAAFSLQKVHKNLRALDGAEVVIVQGKEKFEGFRLVAASRLPANAMNDYFNTSLDNALAYAAATDPTLKTVVNPSEPQIVFETCGWKMAGEPWAAGVTNTTASVYIGVIKKQP